MPETSFWRSPYLAPFKSGNSDFVVLPTHIRWGDSTKTRRQELELLPDWVEAKRLKKMNEDKNLLVMGDFNIPSRTDTFFKAITRHGMQIPEALVGLQFDSNLEKNKRYDQILHHPIYADNFTDAGGVLDFYVNEAHIEELFPTRLTKTEFAYQLSDHLPLWIAINTHIDGQKLEQIVEG